MYDVCVYDVVFCFCDDCVRDGDEEDDDEDVRCDCDVM